MGAENKYCNRCRKTTRHYYAPGEHVYRCMECGLNFDALPKTNVLEQPDAKGKKDGYSAEK